jgi:hypothetical protein
MRDDPLLETRNIAKYIIMVDGRFGEHETKRFAKF